MSDQTVSEGECWECGDLLVHLPPALGNKIVEKFIGILETGLWILMDNVFVFVYIVGHCCGMVLQGYPSTPCSTR